MVQTVLALFALNRDSMIGGMKRQGAKAKWKEQNTKGERKNKSEI